MTDDFTVPSNSAEPPIETAPEANLKAKRQPGSSSQLLLSSYVAVV